MTAKYTKGEDGINWVIYTDFEGNQWHLIETKEERNIRFKRFRKGNTNHKSLKRDKNGRFTSTKSLVDRLKPLENQLSLLSYKLTFLTLKNDVV